MGQGVYAPGFDSQTAGNKEKASSGITAAKEQWRNKPCDSKRKNCTEERNQLTVQDRWKLSCFYTNANSLVQKLDELRDRAFNCNYDIIAVVETWAHSGYQMQSWPLMVTRCTALTVKVNGEEV